MSRFKDRLWSDLVRSHGADLNQLSRPQARSRSRPRLLAGTGLGLVTAGSTAAILVATAGTTPAFAVTKNHDGSVTVSISRVAGIPQANARLAALGLRARVVQVTAACGGPRGWARSIHPPPAVFRQIRAGAWFDPRRVPPGRVLVMPAWRLGRAIRIRPGQVVDGRPPACLPPPPVPGALGGACPGGPFFRLPAPRRIERPGRPQIQLPGGPQLQISGGPQLRITSGRQLQITAGQTNQHGHGGTWIHISVSCPGPVTSRVPAPGQRRPHPKHR